MSIVTAIEEYESLKPTYTKLGEKVHGLLLEVLELSNINIHASSLRVKAKDSFIRKIKLKGYQNPFEESTDILGIRIIAYVEDDVSLICTLIRETFDVDEVRSVNKNEELGNDRVGYRSFHLICSLKSERAVLPEYRKFANLIFEIQVRTILQHSWAEIEHDKNYKFSGELPTLIKRRLMLLSGTLELVDREFNQLSKEIDDYIKNVKEQIEQGDELNITINTTALREYLDVKFERLVSEIDMEPSFVGIDSTVIAEMTSFGITTLKDLDDIIPLDYIEKMINYYKGQYTNYLGAVRDIMLISDIEKFINKSFHNQFICDSIAYNFLKLFGIDILGTVLYPEHDEWVEEV